MKTHLWSAIRLTVVMIVLTSGLYTLFLLGFAKTIVPGGGNVKLLGKPGEESAAVLLAQSFTDPKYFHGRPSAVNYNAASSGGSNKGPTNPEYIQTISQRIDTFLVRNPGTERSSIPSELVTASGSGLDPFLSRQAVLIQVPRIARERNVTEAMIIQLIERNIEGPDLGIFGMERVNINKLNKELNDIR